VRCGLDSEKSVVGCSCFVYGLYALFCLFYCYYISAYRISIRNSPSNRDFLEKLTVDHLVNKFPTFYGIRTFITVFSEPLHWTVTYAKWATITRLIALTSVYAWVSPTGFFPFRLNLYAFWKVNEFN